MYNIFSMFQENVTPLFVNFQEYIKYDFRQSNFYYTSKILYLLENQNHFMMLFNYFLMTKIIVNK